MRLVLLVTAVLALLALLDRYTVQRLPPRVYPVLYLLMCGALGVFALTEK